MEANIFLGIALHAIGGLAAATCFVPQKGTKKWSYQSFWLLMCISSWLVMPLIVAYLTVPELAAVISETPMAVKVKMTVLGAAYGFGGMAFAMAIRHIGFSLTYAIAIGISAVLGTLLPAIENGTLLQDISREGGGIVYSGLAVAMLGVIICARAGIYKERSLSAANPDDAQSFNIKKGLVLVVVAGVLSAIFGYALAAGAPMDAIAAKYGAGKTFMGFEASVFQGNAKFIFAMGGAFVTNIIWWGVVHTKEKTWGEYLNLTGKVTNLPKHYLMAIFAGILWYCQFLFYGIGHVRMGDFQFISWGIHMAMLVFFSFGIGFILREWKGVCGKTTKTLFAGLFVLLASFALITYGSFAGQSANTENTQRAKSGH